MSRAALSAPSPAPSPARSRRAGLRLALGAAALAGTPWAWSAGAAAPGRVVSVGGAITEIIYALGAGGALVGVDSTSTYPPEATRQPVVGYARALSSEGILALAPALVVASEEAGPPLVLRQLQGAGVPVQVLAAHHRFEGLLTRVARLGELLGRQDAAAQLAQRLRADWQAARARVAGQRAAGPRVLFVLSHSPSQIVVGGQGSAAEAMLHYAGARNAVQSFAGFKPLTPEAVVAAQPDVVLLTEQGLQAIGGLEGALKLPGLQHTPAGRARRIVAHDALLLLGFGPRLPVALAALDASLREAMGAAS
ncbi:helical backbone metal receptor [Melaminivora jejuensis]|uniref:heme/hemin ABC transporter substrate-binding protein n=1 Tax=Melaminivora jejuensis TaxID=1267217 RepID=UPI001AE02EDE|nr:helical backbone metal receptor [Melaminivora jejuensis]UHJ65805.1 helical backbone metal receptor [Melaminivora jejuensis]